MGDAERLRRSELVMLVGLFANVLLAVVKTVVGILEGSQALLADGINSTADVIYFVAALALVRMATKEPDHEHPYGHAQSESIASLLIGAFVITTGVAVFYNSLGAAATREPSGGEMLALGVAAATVLTKVGLVLYTVRVGQCTGNPAVLAIAADHKNDVYAAMTVVAGIGAARLGLPILDPIAGIVVSFFIITTGLHIVRDAAEDLMGTLPQGGMGEEIKNLVGCVQGVRDIGDVRAHRFGHYLVLQVEIAVDPRLSVEQGHAIATEVEHMLASRMERVRQVYTHVSPADVGQAPARPRPPSPI